MSNFEVVSHEHDSDAGVYRVVVGQRIDHEQVMVDENGQTLYSEYDDDGAPIGEPMRESVSHVVPFEDFVFADHDDRWQDKTDEQIVDSQLRSIKRVLHRRIEEIEAATRAPTQVRQLPGVGRSI